eukprot:CAMPEP_0204450698 /NCGR_PEP_ID=MMETSP0470-20130426/100482_1 /ASSEMBLY_ACC=CAM_ASM_000385 /TAXON_ID=2969 /ORGANISM="Oxyrrhis marina" /LENGTH=179 /DNA_ID=CAMNT_0051450539 /DNA_START=109 /DNA_END=648 /DNA_ORIENTATION=+
MAIRKVASKPRGSRPFTASFSAFFSAFFSAARGFSDPPLSLTDPPLSSVSRLGWAAGGVTPGRAGQLGGGGARVVVQVHGVLVDSAVFGRLLLGVRFGGVVAGGVQAAPAGGREAQLHGVGGGVHGVVSPGGGGVLHRLAVGGHPGRGGRVTALVLPLFLVLQLKTAPASRQGTRSALM